MTSNNDKISIRQTLLLFFTTTFTPAIRIMPKYAAKKAQEVAWLSPVFCSLMLIILSLVWQGLYNRNKDCSLMDIYSNIAGNIIGKILAVIHLCWMILLTALYVRYFAIRLVGSIYPNVNINIFIISMLVTIAYTLRSGLVTLARLNEVVFLFFIVMFYALLIFISPRIEGRFLTPVSYRSIIPAFNASIGAMGIWVYFSLLFIIGDRIKNKEKIKKIGFIGSIFLSTSLVSIILMTIGVFSHSVVKRTQAPFLIAVKQVSLFNTLEKIESVAIAFWVVSDYVLIGFLSICALHILKFLFKLPATKAYINIYLVFTYVLTLFLVSNAFEIQKLSEDIIIPLNLILGFGLPVLMFILGKIRRRV